MRLVVAGVAGLVVSFVAAFVASCGDDSDALPIAPTVSGDASTGASTDAALDAARSTEDADGTSPCDACAGEAPVAIAANLARPANLVSLYNGVFVTLEGAGRVVRVDKSDAGLTELGPAVVNPWAIVAREGAFEGTLTFGEAAGGGGARLWSASCGKTSACLSAFVSSGGQDTIRGIADDGAGNLFFACELGSTGSKIRYSPVNVGPTMDLFVGEPGAYGIVYAGFGGNGYVFFTRREAAGRVRKAVHDGSAVSDFVTNLTRPEGLAVDVTTLWIADTEGDRIATCPLVTGCDQKALTFARTRHPHAIVQDTANVYWSSGVTPDGAIEWCPKTGCPADGPRSLARNQPNPLGLLLADGFVYWANNVDGGSVMRMRKP